MPRGRPAGSVNRSAKFLHYSPKRWQPEFDLIVIESISGKSNEEVGRLFGYTKEHISNILSTEEARKVKERIRAQINHEFQGTLQERISNIGAQAVKKIEAFISDDTLYTRSPFMFVDRALKIAQASNTLASSEGKSNNTTIVNGNAIVMNGEQASNIRDALLKSKELDSITAGDEDLNKNKITNGSDSLRLKLEA